MSVLLLTPVEILRVFIFVFIVVRLISKAIFYTSIFDLILIFGVVSLLALFLVIFIFFIIVFNFPINAIIIAKPIFVLRIFEVSSHIIPRLVIPHRS
ncbi:hypothetical protein BKA61DRAFT_625909 [Leptodontidium sp. MPI-SDFR-AT-0119]|nr:hypothetical protein BKA61DRAFT_625909 [Leptodontidium sp. MPI-SDFR-AT-0119]